MVTAAKRETDPVTWVFLVLSLVLAGIHLYLGLFAAFVPGDRAIQFALIGVALLAGPIVYFTPYWRSVLYLLGAGFAVYLGVLWVLGGMEYPLIGVLTGITATAFILLALYLFFREETRVAGASSLR